LSGRDSDIVKMFFGVGEYKEPISKDDISEKYGLCVCRIEQIITKSLNKMKNKIKNVA
jgi:DNA-directed RNA polymerase sigma subunit (sigma70/sigma32)